MADLTGKSKQKRSVAVAELEKGVTALKDGDLIQARVHFKTVEKKFTEAPDIARVARDFLRLTEPHEKKEYIPETAQEHFEYGVHLLRYNQPDQALENFEKCLALEPNHTEALYNVACYRAAEGKGEETLKMLDQILELKPVLVRSILDDPDLKSALTPEYIEKIKPPVEEEPIVVEEELTEKAGLFGERHESDVIDESDYLEDELVDDEDDEDDVGYDDENDGAEDFEDEDGV